MGRKLVLHPDSHAGDVTAVSAAAARVDPDRLELRYSVVGAIANLIIPPITSLRRIDNLWRTTCFEAFIAPSSAGPYYEINLSPSTEWAAYRFSGYREGMSVASEIEAPAFEIDAAVSRFDLTATFDFSRFSILKPGGDWRVGLSAIIEDRGGRKSWWALAHGPSDPDFHRFDCFVYEL